MLDRRTLLKEIAAFSIVPNVLMPNEKKQDILLVKVLGLQDCGEPNLNGRIYSKECLENSFKAVSEIGSFYHNDDDYTFVTQSLDFFRTSHTVKSVYMEGNNCIAKIEVLNTPFGRLLKNLITEKKVIFAPKGTGKLDCRGNVSEYKLISIDAIQKKDNVQFQ